MGNTPVPIHGAEGGQPLRRPSLSGPGSGLIRLQSLQQGRKMSDEEDLEDFEPDQDDLEREEDEKETEEWEDDRKEEEAGSEEVRTRKRRGPRAKDRVGVERDA